MQRSNKNSAFTALCAENATATVRIWRCGSFTEGRQYFVEVQQPDGEPVVVETTRELAAKMVEEYRLKEYPYRMTWAGMMTNKVLPIDTGGYGNTPVGIAYAIENARQYKGRELTIAQASDVVRAVQGTLREGTE